MEVVGYEPDMAGEIAAFYNKQMQGVPFSGPVDPRQMEAYLLSAWENESSNKLLDSDLLVMRSDGIIRGFASVGIEDTTEDDTQSRGAIGFLLYERGNRKSGQALISAAHSYIAERTDAPVRAFHQNHRFPAYYLPHAYCSDMLDHVQALLQINGYRKNSGEVYLSWGDFDPPGPRSCSIGVDIHVLWETESGDLPKLILHAVSDGKKIGECTHEIIAEKAGHPRKSAFCTWLGIHDNFQGRNLGTNLLGRALEELRRCDYSNAVISTAWDNYRAFVFYANCGYRAMDWTYGFERPSASMRQPQRLFPYQPNLERR